MKRIFTYAFFVLFLNQEFQVNTALAASNEKSIIEAAKATVQKVFEASNNLRFVDGLDYYSSDADAYYVSNGEVASLEELKASYRQIGSSVELLENKIDAWNATMLSDTTVVFTLPIRLKIKLTGAPEYNGRLVWTGVVQKRDEKWVIVNSHESWLNSVEASAAITPTDEK